MRVSNLDVMAATLASQPSNQPPLHWPTTFLNPESFLGLESATYPSKNRFRQTGAAGGSDTACHTTCSNPPANFSSRKPATPDLTCIQTNRPRPERHSGRTDCAALSTDGAWVFLPTLKKLVGAHHGQESTARLQWRARAKSRARVVTQPRPLPNQEPYQKSPGQIDGSRTPRQQPQVSSEETWPSAAVPRMLLPGEVRTSPGQNHRNSCCRWPQRTPRLTSLGLHFVV